MLGLAGAKPHAKCRIEESTLKPPMLRLWSASLAAALQVRCRSSLPHANKSPSLSPADG